MAQKYKVYYNNRVISICAPEDSATIGKAAKKLSYPFDIKQEWKKFMAEKSPEQLSLVGEPAKLWKEFKALFRYIRAAGGLVKNAGGEYLMIFRNKKWDLPKGKMEEGESPEETAVREVEEECGIGGLKIVQPLESSYHIYELKGKMALKHTFWFEMKTASDKTPNPQFEEGIEKAIWVKPKQFKSWKSEMYPSVWDIVKDVE